MIRFAELDAEAPVFLTLLLDLGNMDVADFLGFGHMRAAAGLAVDGGFLADADEADTAQPQGRADILGLDDAGIGRDVPIAGELLLSSSDVTAVEGGYTLPPESVAVVRAGG